MSKTKKEFELKHICESRNIIFGITTIIIAFFHSSNLNVYEFINNSFIANLLNFIQKTGNYGVDIFLFLSGIGLYFSFTKNNIEEFYKNRIVRVIPIFIIVTFVYDIIINKTSILEFISNLTLANLFVTGYKRDWFILIILLLYLVYPIIYKIIKKYDLDGLLLSIFSIILFNLIYLILFPISYNKIEILLTRMPVFIFGTYFGKLIYNNKTISTKILIISMITQIIISLFINYNLKLTYFGKFTRYLYCPLAISTIINFSFIYSKLKNKNNIILKFLKFIGNHSLEVYLIYEKVISILENKINYSSYLKFYILCFIITIFIAYILRKIINILSNKEIYKCIKKKKFIKNKNYMIY